MRTVRKLDVGPAAAEQWCKDHYLVWEQMVSMARARCYANKAFSMAYLVERARWDLGRPFDRVGVYKISNSLVSGLARKLLNEVPEAARFIKVRKTSFDPPSSPYTKGA